MSLKDIFNRQKEFMELLKYHDKLPEWPVDMTTKPGQRIIKETIFNMLEEACEASFTLKNKNHRLSDVSDIDYQHYLEEIGDTLAYLIEVCVLSGISCDDLYNEYCRKNEIVKNRLLKGY